jgi:hypothetical protein
MMVEILRVQNSDILQFHNIHLTFKKNLSTDAEGI